MSPECLYSQLTHSLRREAIIVGYAIDRRAERFESNALVAVIVLNSAHYGRGVDWRVDHKPIKPRIVGAEDKDISTVFQDGAYAPIKPA